MRRIDPHYESPDYQLLERLALDLRWSWNHSADPVWKALDSELWEFTHNPWVVLQSVSREKLKIIFSDSKFRSNVEKLVKERENQSKSTAWFQEKHRKFPLSCIAYFSMEFMLSEALPIYSGGLGNVAGDMLKAASDLGVPFIAIGLLYQQGYFRQIIDKDGRQEDVFPYNDPGQLPITPLRRPNGEWLRIEIKLPGWSVWIRTWEVQVGRCKLYLLDSNDAANYPPHRGITSELYVNNPDTRLKQEIILGICGWLLLEELGLQPEICHLNEGHAAFAVLERAYRFMKKTGVSFQTALTTTRAGNLFTTHTAVSEGFDRFSPALIEGYFGPFAEQQLGISMDEFLALGRRNPNDSRELFNMAYLAIRGSSAVNGVSQLHEEVSQQIFEPLFPRWPRSEIPVGHVTNGVHMPSWDSALADQLWTEVCGKCRWLGEMSNLEKIRTVSDEVIWQMRNASRQNLIEYSRDMLSRQLAARGASSKEVEHAKELFDPNVLTIGFARRFVSYKRPNLLLHDLNRLLNILTNSERPVQLIIAGKAHPADLAGKELIHEWLEFIEQAEGRAHTIFLGDYDMLMTEQLVQGVDLWINTPRRPWEACGTSGMKTLVNGGLNLSELDGWWAEAYSPDVGWAIGDGKEHDHDSAWDDAEANALYTLLEKEIVPEFYDRDTHGLPVAWIHRIRESMARLSPTFSATRMVCEYVERYYLPAAKNYRERSANQGALGQKIEDWRKEIDQKWSKIRFGTVSIETKQDQHFFEVHVNLDGLDPNAIKVQLYCDGMPPKEMSSQNGGIYRASVPAIRPASNFTPRIIPNFPNVMVPLETTRILWQR